MTTPYLRLRGGGLLALVAAAALACGHQKGAEDASSRGRARTAAGTAGESSAAPAWVGPYNDEQKQLLAAPVDAAIENRAHRVYPELSRFTFLGEAPVTVPDDLLGYADLITRTLDESPLTYVFRSGPDALANPSALWGPSPPNAPDPWRRVDTLGGQLSMVDAQPPPEIREKLQLATMGQPSDTLALLREASEMNGAPPGVFAMLADAALAAGDPATAEKAALSALEIDPRFPHAHRALAEVYLKRGEKDHARLELARTLAAYPTYDRAWHVAEVLLNGPIHRPVDVPPPFIEVANNGAVIVVSCERPLCEGYAACKAAFRYEEAFRHTTLGEHDDAPYHVSATEEVVCLEAGLGAHISAQEDGTSQVADPTAELLLRLAQEHGLTSYAMFEIIGQHRPEWLRIAPEPGYQATVQYVLIHVLSNPQLPPVPGTPGGPPVTAQRVGPVHAQRSGG